MWIAGLDAGAELFEGAVGDEMAAVDDGDVGAEALDDFEDVGGEEDGGAAGDHALKHGFERAGGDGVDAFEGLVEEEDSGPWMTAAARASFFCMPWEKSVMSFFVSPARPMKSRSSVVRVRGGGGVEAVHAADEAEVFGGGEAAEEGEAFGDDADLAFHFDGVCGDCVEAEDLDGAGGGREQAGEHLDGGGFTCAVGAEEAEELAGGDGEVDVSERR